MTKRKDRIRVHIEGQEFSVVGGGFREMLAAVKQINGRRFVSQLKVWQLPGTVEEVQHQLEINDYQLEGGLPVTAQTTPAQSSDRIRVLIGEHRLAVIGGSFQDMLAAVKNLPGRRFDGENKIWEIPGELGLIKGMIEAAGFKLQGAENTPLVPVPPMEAPDFSSQSTPPPLKQAPDFFGHADVPPFEPPDWLDNAPPPPLDDSSYDFDEPMPFDYEASPFEAEASPLEAEASPFEAESSRPMPAAAPTSTPGSDRIRIRLGETPLLVSGGSFQEMLAAVKNISGRRFNPAERVWEIPENVTLESVQRAISAAGFVVRPE